MTEKRNEGIMAPTRDWRSEASEQWLHEVLYFLPCALIVDNFRPLNRQLPVATKSSLRKLGTVGLAQLIKI